MFWELPRMRGEYSRISMQIYCLTPLDALIRALTLFIDPLDSSAFAIEDLTTSNNGSSKSLNAFKFLSFVPMEYISRVVTTRFTKKAIEIDIVMSQTAKVNGDWKLVVRTYVHKMYTFLPMDEFRVRASFQ